MKVFICSEFPEDYVKAENIAEAKGKMCKLCIEDLRSNNYECDGLIEADSSEIPAIKASKNLLINIGNYMLEMKGCIKELISAIDDSTFCKECCDKGCACSDCSWFKAKNKALKLLDEVEE